MSLADQVKPGSLIPGQSPSYLWLFKAEGVVNFLKSKLSWSSELHVQ